MDYKELISKIRGHYFDLTVQESLSVEQQENLRHDLWNVETAITDLLDRAEAAEARAEKAKMERDAAVKYIRHYGWCAGCKYFRGVRGCAGPGLKNCTEQNDYYEFGQKEG